VLERAQGRREEILVETERQIVDLVLLMTRKVIKIISETQKDVVQENIIQALRKVKSRGTITIRVNVRDLQLTTEHIGSFIQKMEGVKGIQVAEDSTVDPGGCIIETDFGEIDARISSQLAELEAKILEISSIKEKPKAAPDAAAAALSAGLGTVPSSGVTE
jgi:flagellar assembly protein FliH